jgi:hypothetical protein
VSQREQPPRFLLDRSLGRKAVPEALRADGWDVITSGAIINDTNTITVVLNRRAYSPVLRQSDLRADTAVPGGKAATSASSSANRRHDSLHGNPR